MANTTQPVKQLKEVLQHGELSSHIQQLANAGDIHAIKNLLDAVLADPRLILDPNEPNFSLQFNTPHSTVTLEYDGNSISIRENKKKDLDADLPTRIKKGLAPIEEIERALETGSMTDIEFKDALKNIEPHVSEHYRLLLTHENEVYERKGGPAIKVELQSGVLYAEDEKEREKKLREEKEAAMEKKPEERTAYDIKSILDGIIPAVTLEGKVQQGKTVIELMSYLSMIDNPVEIEMLVGVYANAGIEIINVNGSLMVVNENEYIEQHKSTTEEYKECQELVAEKQAEIDSRITTALFSGASRSEIGALYAMKDELELVVEEAHAQGKTEEEIKLEIEEAAGAAPKGEEPEVKLLSTMVPQEKFLNPEQLGVEPDGPKNPDNPNPEVDPKNEKEMLMAKIEGILKTGQVPARVIKDFADKGGVYTEVVANCWERGYLANYPELRGVDLGGITLTQGMDDKGDPTYTIQKQLQRGPTRTILHSPAGD